MPRPTDRNDSASANSRPTDYDALKLVISERYDKLSKRLQQVAEYALAHPDDMALETIAVIASRAKVPPSSLIRFSKALGFDGFTRMQRLFRDRLLARTPTYGERIDRLSAEGKAGDLPMPSLMLHEVTAAGIEGLERLRQDMQLAKFEEAITLLSQARLIHVVAQRRAFPVASYLNYLMNQLGRPTRLLEGIGGMLSQQERLIMPDDVLIAISFQPYAPEVVALVERVEAKGVPLIGITDGPLSPLIRPSDVIFEIVEGEAHGFRTLSAAMCLVLALTMSFGHHLRASS